MEAAGPKLRIFVDADACPVKDEVYRVAARHGLTVFVVANSPIVVPRAAEIDRVVVGRDQRPIAQANWLRSVDAVEQRSRLGRIEHGRFAALHDVLRAAHRRGRFGRLDLADGKPIEQVPQRGLGAWIGAWRRFKECGLR